MPSHLAFFSALSILTLTAGLECMHKKHVNGEGADEKVIECTNSNATFCMWFEGLNTERNTTASVRNCAESDDDLCTKDECRQSNYSVTNTTIPGTLCCCRGDFCNSLPFPHNCYPNSASLLTGLLSIVTLAAVVELN